MNLEHKKAFLALADGTVFEGQSIGISGLRVGEVVFNTSLTGYQEMLTDPSYAQQILTLTYPQIGNVGTNRHDIESSKIYAAGLVVRDVSMVSSNWRSEETLEAYLKANHTVGISRIDTRQLTRLLREKGAQSGCLMAGVGADPEKALEAARSFAGLKGMDLAKVVSTREPYVWMQGSWELAENQATHYLPSDLPFRVVAYDFGIKHSILRQLVDKGCRVQVVPAQTTAAEALQYHPHGIVLSNGPGDPEPCDYAIQAIQEFLALGIPLFGICLGHQLLGLAAGAKTIKTKFGHHGANHPVQELATGKVWITSQNHGFAIDEATLPAQVKATHRSLFDKTLQGIAFTDKPAFGFQGHPEAGPGPQDANPLFQHFIQLMKDVNL